MRKEIVSCYLCGLEDSSEEIKEYCIRKPEFGKIGHSVFEVQYERFNMHDSCFQVFKKVLEEGWNTALDAAKHLNATIDMVEQYEK